MKTLMVMLIASILAIGGTALLGLRFHNAKKAAKHGVAGATKIMKARAKAVVAGVLATVTMLTSTGVAGYRLWRTEPDDSTAPPLATAADTDQTSNAAPPLTLTDRQINDLISRYSFKFNEIGLASNVGQRKDAIKEYGEAFSNPVNIPISEVLDKIKDIKSMTKDEQDKFFNEEVREIIYVTMAGDPQYTEQFFKELLNQPLFMENNSDIIKEVNKLFDDAYDLSVKTTKNGLDYFLSDDYSTCTDEYQRKVFARAWGLLEYFEVKGITNATSVRNYCAAPAMEDSRTRTTLAKEQENLSALKLVYCGKDGSEQIVFGINLLDRRLEVFEPGKTTTKNPTTPSKPTTQAKPTPTKPTTPKTPLYNVTVAHVYVNPVSGSHDTIMEPKQWLQVKSGHVYEYVPPKTIKSGGVTYTLKDPDRDSYVYGTVQSKDVYREIEYTLAADPHLIIYYKYEDGSRAAKTYNEPYAVGEHYRVPSPEIKGYTPSLDVVKGDMTAKGAEYTVVYRRTGWLLTIKYVDATNPSREVATAHTDYYAEGERYRVPSPEVPGYMPDRSIVYGDMPNRNHTEIVYYETVIDGKGGKDTRVDPVNQGTADIGGGENLPGDKTGDYQKEEPERKDYPNQGDQDKVINGSGNSSTPVRPNDSHEGGSSGTGGIDHDVIGNNPSDKVDNGKIPDKNPVNGTTVSGTDKTTGQTSTPANEKEGGAMQMPD